jgi:putative salt-induced outer membrane protein YdiY
LRNEIFSEAKRKISVAFLALTLVAVAGSSGAQEEKKEEKKLGWKDSAELALVVAGGNSATSTLGFRNLLSRVWSNAELNIEAAGLRTSTTSITRTPIGATIDDFDVVESRESALTAENYLARGKYDRQVSSRFFVYGSGGWDRNEFAGTRNRYTAAGGVGNIWYDREDARWRTDYGISVTHEEPTISETVTYAGLRLSSDFMRKLTGSTTLTNLTIADENLDNTNDFRLDSLTAVAVSMTSHLAVKASVKFLFDNDPSFIERELVTAGVATGIFVPVQAKNLDTLFNMALVVSF